MIHILTTPKWAPIVAPIVSGADVVSTKHELSGGECLLAFNTGVIVPANALARYQRAYNFHAAPPTYPGRDPHHWAVYDNAEEYGVTAHVMSERVDEGPIIAVERFSCIGMSPEILRRYAEARLLGLFTILAPQMARGLLRRCGEDWSGIKRKRADLLAMLDLSNLHPVERRRREVAFQGFIETPRSS